MTGTVYIIRHGMTDANKQKSFQGVRDIPLNGIGRCQAQALAEYFKKMPLDAIYASPLLRAHETAKILAESKGLEVQDVADLHEISFGIWEGMAYADVQSRWPEEYAKFLNCPSQCHPDNGEWLSEVQVRIRSVFEKIMDEQKDGFKIAIVMHGGSGRIMLCDFFDIPLDKMWRFSMGNCSVSTVSIWYGKAVLEGFNDHHFLPDSGDFLKSFFGEAVE